MPPNLHWPANQHFLSPTEISERMALCDPEFTARCRDLRVPNALRDYLETLYLPLAAWVDRRRAQQSEALIIGLCGGQGSGKTTVATLLKAVLESGFQCATVSVSIDDIYKTKAEREQLAKSVHPLFATRGVPFTHDVELGITTLRRLRVQGDGQSTVIPRFDKANDTRFPRPQWSECSGRVDVIILEGWCVGAVPQRDDDLIEPVNALERDEDPQGIWRRRANDALKTDYQELFGMLDALVMLKVEDMAQVFAWRRLQEQKLFAMTTQDTSRDLQNAIMSDDQVDRFVMHYERITRHILAEMPQRADIVFELDDSHNPARVIVNRKI